MAAPGTPPYPPPEDGAGPAMQPYRETPDILVAMQQLREAGVVVVVVVVVADVVVAVVAPPPTIEGIGAARECYAGGDGTAG